MNFDTINRSVIQSKIAPLIGQRAWQPNQGIGSFLTFEFGTKVPRKPIKSKLLKRIRKGPQLDRGEWHLWIYMCEWRIEKGSEILAGSEDDHSKVEIALQSFNNKTLTSMEILSSFLDTLFIFEDEVNLRTFSRDSKECEHWMLFTPDENVLSLGPGSSWSYSKSSEP